jgi:hypothetical protein
MSRPPPVVAEVVDIDSGHDETLGNRILNPYGTNNERTASVG